MDTNDTTRTADTSTGIDAARPLADLLEPGDTVMVGTRSASGDLDFRPLTVARVQDDRIEILVDTTADWAKRFDGDDAVVVTASDNRKNQWITLHGTAVLSEDRGLIDELWNPMAGAYFDQGRETPGIAAMIIEGDQGVYWASPSGRVGSLISMVRAALGGAERSGDHGEVAL